MSQADRLIEPKGQTTHDRTWIIERLFDLASIYEEGKQPLNGFPGFLRATARRIETSDQMITCAAQEALLVIAVLKITDEEKPYIEISPELRAKIKETHDLLVKALSGRSVPEGEKSSIGIAAAQKNNVEAWTDENGKEIAGRPEE